jgi:pyruvate formate lyase activating enzyme
MSQKYSRRRFLADLATAGAGIALGGAGMVLWDPLSGGKKGPMAWAGPVSGSPVDRFIADAPAARYWISANTPGVNCLSCHQPDEKIQGNQFDHGKGIVKCMLCAQGCVLLPGDRGKCRARINAGGEVKSLVYGRPVSIHVDPIEKKPFYHFLPGAPAFSLATAGCPLHCKFCQNWEISQARPEDFPGEFVPAGRIAETADRRGAPVIAFTYNEPTVFAEYMLDIAAAAREKNIRSVLISCGFMNPDPLNDMCAALSAIKIDLKGFDREFYRKVCGAELEPVLRSIQQIARRGVHLEIVNLVVPTLNDSDAMLTDLVKWVLDELGPDVPLHFTRFHPDYQMLNLPPTPISTLERAYEIARTRGLHYPFVGNVPGHAGNHSFCPSCGKAVIKRTGFFVTEQALKNGRCAYCDAPIAGVWA